MADPLERDLEERIEQLGYEVVELERAGNVQRPILRLRIDRPDAEPGKPAISVEDCTRVSRALEAFLDERPELISPTYTIEVSSPGVERPLLRRRDFERFAGQEVVLQGKAALAGRSKRLEGVLLGVRGEGAEERVVLRLPGEEELEIPRGQITRAHLLFRWGGAGRNR